MRLHLTPTRRAPLAVLAATLVALLSALVLVALPAVAAAQGTELHLFRSFAVPPPGAWADVAVPLAPAGWRVGAPDGPPATAADLARWQGAPGLVVVAGRCAGAQSGSTHYPCAFELAPQLPAAAQPADALTALMPWQTTSDERMARYDLGLVQAASVARGGLGPQAAALLRSLLPDDSRLLGFYAPAAALRGAGGSAALLPLRLRGVDNPLAKARFERQGLLVLSTRPAPVPVPAPVLAKSERAI